MGRNYIIGIQANVDAGMTTLTEQLLYYTNSIRKSGSVDEGTTTSDFLEGERRRGISVRTSVVELKYEGDTIRILDTPGHLDFSGEVLRSLYALDGAVLLVSASNGAEGRTETLYHALRTLGIPLVVCINKTDLPGFSREDSLKDAGEELMEPWMQIRLSAPEELLGRISMHLMDYRPVPEGIHETFPRRGVDPLDRAKWILACRSALGSELTGRE